MSTDCLFRDDSYLKECGATVIDVTGAGGVIRWYENKGK